MKDYISITVYVVEEDIPNLHGRSLCKGNPEEVHYHMVPDKKPCGEIFGEEVYAVDLIFDK